MNKIETFTKENLAAIRKEVDAAFAVISDKLGIELKMGNTSFSELSFTSKVEGKIQGKRKDYSEIYPFMNLPKIGTEFRIGGVTYIVHDHNIKRPKYPVVGIKKGDVSGDTYKFTCDHVNKNKV